MSQFLSISFLASIYFFARGVFALFGQTTFYTKRHLEHIDESDLPAYLKQIGIAPVAVGVVFLAKAILKCSISLQQNDSLCIFAGTAGLCLFHQQDRQQIQKIKNALPFRKGSFFCKRKRSVFTLLFYFLFKISR